jgi:general secretion pathway protein B
MSYILDALNKADTERDRQRSAVPGLQSYGDAERTSAGGGAWRWVALGAIIVLAAVLAWQWFAAPSDPAPTLAAAAPAPQAMPQAVPQAMPQPQPMPAPTALPPAASPVPAAPAREAERPPPAAKAAPTSTKPPAAPASASAPTRLPSRNELPPELRAALPPISISGAVYAPAPKDRLLFANGAVLKEGDALAEGLVVERIGAASSVLAFRGTRFELMH